jgi:hypoxanthine-guanine phosphoribosyltransferase
VHNAKSTNSLEEGLIGKAIVCIKDIVGMGTTVKWVVIKDGDCKNVGEVCLVLRFISTPPSHLGIN